MKYPRKEKYKCRAEEHEVGVGSSSAMLPQIIILSKARTGKFFVAFNLSQGVMRVTKHKYQ